jgi:flagellar basal-body rod modification protein FlgD
MDLSAILAPTSSSAGAPLPSSKQLDKEAFLKLLVQQLQNQDPLSPTPNEEFVAQLASFASLEQMQGLNENMLGLALLQQEAAIYAQVSQASGLIGQEISYVDPETGLAAKGVVDSVAVEEGFAYLKVGNAKIGLMDVTSIHGVPETDGGDGADDSGSDPDGAPEESGEAGDAGESSD